MYTFTEARAFPSALNESVHTVLPLLVEGQSHLPSKSFQVKVRGESLEIPDRVYYHRERVRHLLRSMREGVIVACLGSRHHDGYVREECLAAILGIETPWVVPFVVQLVGEYVLPILQLIERSLPRLNETLYAEYVLANPALFETIGRRVASYWNVYHRGLYRLSDYPGFRIHRELRRMSERAKTAARSPFS